MPKMDGTGPEGKGTGTGRKMGRCKENSGSKNVSGPGKGLGKRGKSAGGQGLGKRSRNA